LKDYGFTQQRLADELSVSRRTVNQLVNGRRGVTADMALRLGRLTKTSPEYWLNLQTAVDLWEAKAEAGPDLAAIKPLRRTKAA
jgi:addiction module HigA family antidote